MLISPTEPASLRAIGDTSLKTESFGADVLWYAQGQWVGIQRKRVVDLVASVHDGRWSEQLGKMKQLGLGVVLIEGRPKWTDDGREMIGVNGRGLSRPAWRGILWSAREEGLWVDWTENLNDTIRWCQEFEQWTAKASHLSGRSRPGPSSLWGTKDSRDWGMHVLQGFEGVGVELSGRIYDRFDGLPFAWSVTVEELCEVEGIGKKKAQKLIGALA